MLTHNKSAGASILVALTVVGCADGTNFDNPEHVRSWANTASALAVYAVAHQPVGFADGQVTFSDATCPATSDDGTTVVIEGGCTNASGERFVGTATVVRGADGARDLTLDGYGSASAENDPVPTSGTVSIRQTAPDTHTFDADYTQDGLTVVTVEGYAGTVSGGYEGATTWSGSGTITRGGFAHGAGTATATTTAELRDPDVCSNQPSSGSTTIEVDGRVLVIEYDGATDCDDEATALYSVDGEDRGRIDGISCAASPGRGGGAAAGVAMLAALGVLLSRRRRLG